jgi:membrane protein required for colicin V production
MSNFQVIDLIFGILIALIAIHGYVGGLIREIFSWAALVIAILAAVFFHPAGAAIIRQKVMPNVRYVPEILAFIGVFLIAMLVCKMIERLLRDVVAGANLGKLDKILGLVFGFIEGLAVTALILFVLSVQHLFDISKLIGDSIFAQILLPHLPEIPFNKGPDITEVIMVVPPSSWLKML